MTNDEYETLKLRMKYVATNALLTWSVSALKAWLSTLPPDQRSLELSAVSRKLSEARKDYSTLAFESLPPAMSDLHAGEFQEAFDTIASQIEKDLSVGS
jgi:hypothetical protein